MKIRENDPIHNTTGALSCATNVVKKREVRKIKKISGRQAIRPKKHRFGNNKKGEVAMNLKNSVW